MSAQGAAIHRRPIRAHFTFILPFARLKAGRALFSIFCALMLPGSIELIVVYYPDRADHEAILNRLVAFNENRAGSSGFKEMAGPDRLRCGRITDLASAEKATHRWVPFQSGHTQSGWDFSIVCRSRRASDPAAWR